MRVSTHPLLTPRGSNTRVHVSYRADLYLFTIKSKLSGGGNNLLFTKYICYRSINFIRINNLAIDSVSSIIVPRCNNFNATNNNIYFLNIDSGAWHRCTNTTNACLLHINKYFHLHLFLKCFMFDLCLNSIIKTFFQHIFLLII